jgi:pilus assembly protein CpaB
VYALKDIPEGQTIMSDALEEKNISFGKIPADAITSAAMASGRACKHGIAQGQIVSQHDLSPLGISAGFESRLRKGMRAVTFAIDNNSAGFITPESQVDIMSMVGSGAETKVAPILSDVHVIAVGQTYEKEPGGHAVPASSVTVSVSPEDSQKLVKAIAASKLYLSLRSQDDHTPVLTVDVTSLFPVKVAEGQSQNELPEPPPLTALAPPSGTLDPLNIQAGDPLDQAIAPPAPLHDIEVWTGGSKSVISLPGTKN